MVVTIGGLVMVAALFHRGLGGLREEMKAQKPSEMNLSPLSTQLSSIEQAIKEKKKEEPKSLTKEDREEIASATAAEIAKRIPKEGNIGSAALAKLAKLDKMLTADDIIAAFKRFLPDEAAQEAKINAEVERRVKDDMALKINEINSRAKQKKERDLLSDFRSQAYRDYKRDVKYIKDSRSSRKEVSNMAFISKMMESANPEQMSDAQTEKELSVVKKEADSMDQIKMRLAMHHGFTMERIRELEKIDAGE